MSAALRTSVFLLATVQSIGMFMSFRNNAEAVHAVHRRLQEIVDKSATGLSIYKPQT